LDDRWHSRSLQIPHSSREPSHLPFSFDPHWLMMRAPSPGTLPPRVSAKNVTPLRRRAHAQAAPTRRLSNSNTRTKVLTAVGTGLLPCYLSHCDLEPPVSARKKHAGTCIGIAMRKYTRNMPSVGDPAQMRGLVPQGGMVSRTDLGAYCGPGPTVERDVENTSSAFKSPVPSPQCPP
jgi:hypothetical protein